MQTDVGHRRTVMGVKAASVVFCDRANPRTEFVMLAQGIEMHPRRYKRVLRCIRGGILVACDFHRGTFDGTLMANDQFFVGLAVAAKRQLDKIAVGFDTVIVHGNVLSFRRSVLRAFTYKIKTERKRLGVWKTIFIIAFCFVLRKRIGTRSGDSRFLFDAGAKT